MFDLSVWLSGAVALACVALMGLAIQRGGTCTVAAMDELLSQRRAWRLAAMLDASLWVAGGALMGAGSSLIPGSNDGLIPVGLPPLRGYAWLAFASMCATILLALWLQGQWRGRWRGRWSRRAT